MEHTLRRAFSHLVLVVIASAAGSALAQKARVVGPIEGNGEVALQQRLHPLARPEFDRGAADAAMKLDYVTMVLKPTAAQQSDLETLLIQQQDRSSASYHKWLTPEQFGDRFGLAASDIAAIKSWIEAQGLRVEDTARGRNWIAFSGTAAQIQRALHTEIRRFAVDGKAHYANATDPSLPAPLADVVRFFRGLDDFGPEPPAGIRNATVVTPEYTSATGGHSMAPDDFATIYDLTPLYQNGVNGDQQKIAVLGRSAIDLPGFQTFRSLYHLPATTPVMHLVGTDPGASSTDDQLEAMLDLEWTGAAAPNATLVYVYATSIDTATQEAIDKNLATVISESYASCEPNSADTLRYLAQQANAQGITWLVGAGDSGAATCDAHGDRQLASTGFAVGYPASIPEITAVGATMFNEGAGTYWNPANTSTGASVISYIPEVGWNENSTTGIHAGPGGASIFYAKPIWQNGPGVPADKARDLPDISMPAGHGAAYRMYFNGLNYTVGGTSAGTPAFAGIMALLNHYQVKNGLQSAPGMGNINPELYRLAQTYPAAFHDVTAGNNYVPCVQSSPDCSTGSFGYTAGPGYDLVTGLGSVDVNNLVTHWNQNGAPTRTSVMAPAGRVTFGTKPQLTATVSASNGAGIPTGTVAFLVPGGGPGTPDLGSAELAVSGGVATAGITVDPNQLSAGDNHIVALFSGDNNFDVSSATTTVTVTPLANAAAIVVEVTPNPVYASASTAGVTTWPLTITLTELAGVAATLTKFNISGTDLSVPTYFPKGTAIPARGTLITSISYTNLKPPLNRVLTFGGTDANGNSWSQQITVPFIGPVLQPEIVLSGAPATVQQNPSADPSCQWTERLNVQELGGYNMQLFKFLAGSNDLTSQISQYFGTTEIAPFGALQATVCAGGSAPPAPLAYELDGMTDSGRTFRTIFTTSYAAAPASPASLSAAQNAVALSAPSNSGSVTAPLDVTLSGGSSNWTATIFPSNATTSWLKIAPASGSGSGSITLTATATGQALGVYRATVIVQGSSSVPQFIEVPISFTVGASPDISIGGVAHGASFQHIYAPGMVLSVFGSGLAPAIQLAGVLPLPLTMQGVSATVNGVAAPLYYVSPGQINLQVPYETGVRAAVVGVNNNGKVASFLFNTSVTAPGIFVQNGNLVPIATGKPGDVLVLFMTGEGDVTPALFTGASPAAGTTVDQLPQPRYHVAVTVGGIDAAIQFEGIPTLLVGTTQINFVIPASVPPGVQPVVVTSNGVASLAANITVTPP